MVKITIKIWKKDKRIIKQEDSIKLIIMVNIKKKNYTKAYSLLYIMVDNKDMGLVGYLRVRIILKDNFFMENLYNLIEKFNFYAN